MNALRVIFVHGISSTIIDYDYTENLRKMIVEELKKQGVIADNATEAQIEEIVTFQRINYSAVGKQEELRALAAYESEKNQLYNLLDKVWDTLFFDNIRQFVITSLSDVLVYESDQWRDQIRGLLVEMIKPYVKTKDAVTIVGHSLGSVVAFDTLYYNSWHNPDWTAANFKPTNLITMGSPVMLFSLELDRQTGEQKTRYLPAVAAPPQLDQTNPEIVTNLVRDEGVWYNFLDAQDLVAYPLQTFFKSKWKIEDILVQTGTQPIKAHTEYWNNQEVARRVAERLKFDYQRINQ